jgi:hypothetical protein
MVSSDPLWPPEIISCVPFFIVYFFGTLHHSSGCSILHSPYIHELFAS